MSSVAGILRRHGIDYVATKSGKFTTRCPNCGGKGYLNVTCDKDGVAWFCHYCGKGGGERFDQKKPSTKTIWVRRRRFSITATRAANGSFRSCDLNLPVGPRNSANANRPIIKNGPSTAFASCHSGCRK